MEMAPAEDVRPYDHSPIPSTSTSTSSSTITLGEAAYYTDGTLSSLSVVQGALVCLVFLGNIPVILMVFRRRTMKPAARWMIGNLAARDIVFGLALGMRSEYSFFHEIHAD